MGFLELNKIRTLELFLTDKGKELMLRENTLGLYDLISQFSLDDRDYDYRRTSEIWVDGVSPDPPGAGSSYPAGNTLGSMGTLNNFNGGTPNNPCWSCGTNNCYPLSGSCWFDMPDVRGDRGQKIINCLLTTGFTAGIQACTNIYAFYDVTSTGLDNAKAAKIGLNEWFNGYSASTPNYTGKLFHIPVYGERWLNTSYYPWNGRLDTVDWNGWGNKYAGDPDFAKPLSGQILHPVTGLYLQTTTEGIATGDWAGFAELPPNSRHIQNGGRAEFWTTGCTLMPLNGTVESRLASTLVSEEEWVSVGWTATTTPTNIMFDSVSVLSGNTYLSGTTLATLFGNTLVGMYDPTVTVESRNNLFNLCVDNCCPDPFSYDGPGLFGCQECSPFDNTISTGKLFNVFSNNETIVSISPGITAGTTTIVVYDYDRDCATYRGMDRNVLIIDIFDEADGDVLSPGSGYNGAGGICRLGEKTFYDGTSNVVNSNFINFDFGDYTTTNAVGTWDNLGYHGRSPLNGQPTNWDRGTNAGTPQPTEDYKYTQDLFTKTYSFYENFRGFVYPVTNFCSVSYPLKGNFQLHMWGAIYGETVPLSDFIENPTVSGGGQTVSVVTTYNPYGTLIPLHYTPTTFYEGGNVRYPAESSLDSNYNIASQTMPYLKGLKNYGWDFNPSVGCYPGPCTSSDISDIFSGGTFSNDLNDFLSGSSFQIQTISTGCTECQCLPAVFLSRKGPILVVDDPSTSGGTKPTEIVNLICGPAPSTNNETSEPTSPVVDSEGNITGNVTDRSSKITESPTLGSPYESQRKSPTANLETLNPSMNSKSTSNKYSPFYSVGFDITLVQNLNDGGDYEWDVQFLSTSRYNNKLIEESDNAKFYWVVSSGFKPTLNPLKETKSCPKVTKQTINENKNKYSGTNFAFLKGYWDMNSVNGKYAKGSNINGMDTYEFCVTMCYSYLNKLLTINRRFRITGNSYGYKLTIVS